MAHSINRGESFCLVQFSDFGRIISLPPNHQSLIATGTFRAKALSKSQIAEEIAIKVGITKKAGADVIDLLAALAYKNAKNTFTLHGIGKLVLVNRAARIGRILQLAPRSRNHLREWQNLGFQSC